MSRDNGRRSDLLVCFITSVPRSGPDMAPIAADRSTGLKVPSIVRFDKIATLDRAVIAGKLGDTPPEWLTVQRNRFFSVFGFGEP